MGGKMCGGTGEQERELRNGYNAEDGAFWRRKN